MQCAVYYYPVQFVCFGNSKFGRILFDTLNRNENIADNSALLFRIIKGNDIRIGVMIKVLLVYLQQVFV
jgi:hypothetical protein